MPVTTYVIGPLTLKWVIAMDVNRIDVGSTEQVPFSVFADQAGTIYNPTVTGTASAAFIASSAKPQTTDWKACVWDTSIVGTYRAACMVGPAGVVTLPVGEYYAWLRIVDTGTNETVIRQTGQLIVQ